MIYDVRQVTTYRYAAPVATASHVLRLSPVDRPGQRVLSMALDVEPWPAERSEARDFFGNGLTRIALHTRHEALVLRTTARIDVTPPPVPEPEVTPPWETVRELAWASADLTPTAPVHHLFPSRRVPVVADITAYAAESFARGRPILASAFELACRIKADFAYEPGATDVTTPVATAFALKRGVCQDFSEIMIAGLRGLGLAAGYVSGFLRTEPPPGQERLEGADATHAWVSLWCGPRAGWIGLDPTNAMLAGLDHIVLAVGRDYADAAPVDGVIIATGDHALDVAVDVVPVDAPAASGPV
ncbi:transglutaminase family protein [Blastochloris sulfoviridis]|uniref:Transglutaminase family protein n=1 Tax=Blastochloris sulfoviridis TaxID=50712 RepID=A0A5M6HYZ7_9HYPH|nr:transglutaminase family protein [Blastochloris sulfoviridis]KAA5601144.1 transglutaminase family protein [Blastochloris sulfoviridis]